VSYFFKTHTLGFYGGWVGRSCLISARPRTPQRAV
jgi:hypothetical protein